MKLLLVTFVLLGLGCLSLAKRKSDCGPCDKSSCPEPVNCVADTVLDECNCCEQCGLAEGELCDLPKQDYKYGRCGKKLECRERSDAPGESTCFCKHTKPICGSDGVTYRNICNLKEIKVLQNKDDLKVADKGPCKYAPKIVSLPEHQKNHTGTSVAISCEAEGYPIPSIDWFVTRSNDESIRLPEDDDKVSLYTRGGPEKYRITGWIQVMKMEKHHEGDYTCVATNKLGMQKAMARLIVLDENDERDRGL